MKTVFNVEDVFVEQDPELRKLAFEELFIKIIEECEAKSDSLEY